MTLPKHGDIQEPLLREILANGGEAKPSQLYPKLRQYFPNITDSDLQATLKSTGGNVWTNRIQWARHYLVKKGDLYKEPHGLWRITPQGQARVEGAPIVESPPIIEKVNKTEEKAKQTAIGVVTDPPMVMVADKIEHLCESLLKTQQQSSTPKNFEATLATAFRFLGFDAQEQGKAGETDVLLNTYIGPDSYRVVVDAKATHGNKVSDGQINWLAINQHQQHAQAQYAAVVGIDFAGGNLLKWANEYHIALLRTEDLVNLIRMHRRAPFSLVELRPLFGIPGPAQQSMQDLRLIYESTILHWQLLLNVVEQISNYNRYSKTGLVATPEGIQLMLYTKVAGQMGHALDASHIPSTEDVKEAMGFLASRAIGVLKEAPSGSGKYHLTTHFDGVVRRITALAQHLEGVDLAAPSAVGANMLKNV